MDRRRGGKSYLIIDAVDTGKGAEERMFVGEINITFKTWNFEISMTILHA